MGRPREVTDEKKKIVRDWEAMRRSIGTRKQLMSKLGIGETTMTRLLREIRIGDHMHKVERRCIKRS